ncbi:anaerobic sulfatase maturase [Psychrobacter sp. H8-1]|uniref:anaerobic sulfatase maturase n=1 Tax=Psychrobacter sp. H8-1 TaxID=2774129 RepID=UPI00191B5AA1|nr:anaerobic sulfatase maturase [Psychrobacter sp. H8-1]
MNRIPTVPINPKSINPNASNNPSIYPKLRIADNEQVAYRFHTMLKPSGSACNINCDYCFYLHKQDLLNQPKHPRMPEATLDQHIRQYIEAQFGAEEVVFTWQGGEPTLMGLDFFARVVELQKQYCPDEMVILNDIQTNGLLLDDKWCQFLAANNFLVGISIDGPKHLHDRYRRTNNDKPTHDLVMAAIKRLKTYDIPFNALCVINDANAKEPLAVYRFLRDEVEPRMIQFLAGVEPLDFKQVAPLHWQPDSLKQIDELQDTSDLTAMHEVVTEWSVTPEGWGEFLTIVWQEWIEADIGRVFVDHFENTLSQILNKGAQKCTTAAICGKALALEHNGDLYCCDHFVYPEYKLGNIHHTHQGDLAFSKKQTQFGYLKQSTLPEYCKQCDFLTLCWGDCPKHRFIKAPDGEVGLSYLCAGLKMYYAQVSSDLLLVKSKLGWH